MGQKNVSEMMERMGIHLNGEKAAPDSGSDEYNVWLEALDESQDDWADLDYDWETLRATHKVTMALSGTSVGLPDGFVKLAGFPKVIGKEYEEVYAEKTGLKETSDQYVSVDYAQKYMTINPALASVGLVEVPYFSRPTSLASPADVSVCPSDNFLVHKAIAKVMINRSDSRYSEYEDKADMALARMLGKEVHVRGQRDTSIKNELHEKHDFVMGVD